MKTEKSNKRKIRAAQVIIPPAAVALALTGCADTGGSDTDNVIDGASFTTPVTVAGLPGQATGFSSYKVFQPALADMDGDGDLDMFVGAYEYGSSSYNFQKIVFFKNTTSSDTISFEKNSSIYSDTLPEKEVYVYGAVAAVGPMLVGAGCIDSDANVDIVASYNYTAESSYTGGYHTFIATGETSLPGDSISIDSFNGYTIALADLDGDSNLDLIMGTLYTSYHSGSTDPSSKTLSYIKNNGSGGFTGSETSLVSYSYTNMKSLPIPSFADLDNDGDQDMFVVTYDTGVINYYENTGSATSPSFTSRTENFNLSPPGGVKWFPAFGDMDGDGDLDAMIGTSDGKILYAENLDIE